MIFFCVDSYMYLMKSHKFWNGFCANQPQFYTLIRFYCYTRLNFRNAHLYERYLFNSLSISWSMGNLKCRLHTENQHTDFENIEFEKFGNGTIFIANWNAVLWPHPKKTHSEIYIISYLVLHVRIDFVRLWS